MPRKSTKPANGKNTSAEVSITSMQQEKRKFAPPKSFSEQARISSEKQLAKMRKRAAKDPVGFWEDRARELDWFRPWKTALKWKYPFAQWFIGGKLNIAYNCLDRHLDSWKRNKAALVWEGEPGDIRTLTYQELYSETCRFANALKSLGVKKGDVVAIYMGMVPEAVVAMLACARIGATHNVIFGGFSAEALRERIEDSKAVCVVTQDGTFRRGSSIGLKPSVDAAIAESASVKNVVVVRRTGQETAMQTGRDHWWHELREAAGHECAPEKLDSEHPLFILYTSGSTGKPKGILHTTGGYLTQAAYTFKTVFDIRDEDLYFCTADIGWVTGHSYVVYGPLANGATVFMYEGAVNHPAPDRLWDIIERHRVTILYTAPTAIRSFMRWGEQHPKKHDLSSLRLLGTVGEPINPEAWIWYHTIIGNKRCPIVDTWWQTETGAIMISPIPGATVTKPGTATMPLPGIIADVVRKDGESCNTNEGGFLVVKHPWPSMLRTILNDPDRYTNTYWGHYPPSKTRPAYYLAGDGARIDDDGHFWIMGRVDDVVNVSGHRLGTAEIESALVSDNRVAEAAVVARPDEIKGSALVAFVTVKSGTDASPNALEALQEQLRATVAKQIGSIAKPDAIRFTDALPKTRSGKIMRRLLRELVTQGSVSGDTTTLEDFSVLEKLRDGDEE